MLASWVLHGVVFDQVRREASRITPSDSRHYLLTSARAPPLSLGWIDERVVLATEAGSVTAGNITSQGGARLGLGPTRDVVMIDAELEHVYSLDEVPAGLARGYAAQAGWDPRESGDSMRFLVLRPLRIQAWREPDELPGRTLMRGGAWIP